GIRDPLVTGFRRVLFRSFTVKIVAAVPAMTTLVSPPTRAQQTARPGPPAGRGPMDGSPLGDPLPGQKWRVHDRTRPQPRRVTPGQPVAAPSAPPDAIVLFDGRDLSKWNGGGRGGAMGEPKWKVENGCVELIPGVGSLITKESFGDVQLHLEWTTP